MYQGIQGREFGLENSILLHVAQHIDDGSLNLISEDAKSASLNLIAYQDAISSHANMSFVQIGLSRALPLKPSLRLLVACNGFFGCSGATDIKGSHAWDRNVAWSSYEAAPRHSSSEHQMSGAYSTRINRQKFSLFFFPSLSRLPDQGQLPCLEHLPLPINADPFKFSPQNSHEASHKLSCAL